MVIERQAWRKREQARHSSRERFIIERMKVTGFRVKLVLSFYSQPFLYPINGKLCPGGRGPQFIFGLQLGSCGQVVEGISWVRWSCRLEKLAPAGKNRISP